MLLLMFKVFALLFFFMGYFVFIQKKGIHIAFAPILTVSGISVVIFLAGVWNILPLTVWAIYLGGLFLAGYYLVAFIRNTPPREYLSSVSASNALPVLFFVVLYGLSMLRVRNALPTHYDNFSHWLLVIADMVRSDQLPCFQSGMIRYQSYPTGSANFIYFICKMTDSYESFILLGQCILLASCLTVFWAFVKKSFKSSGLLISLASVYLLAANNVITDLTVDSLLGLVGITSFAVLVYYKNDIRKCTICNCIISTFLILIKNSGIFFVGILWLLLSFFWLKTAKAQSKRLCSKDTLLPLAINLSVPLVILYLWNRHVAYSFSNATTRKHSMTAENYSNVLHSKSVEEIRSTFAVFLERLTKLGPESAVLIILAGLYGIYFLLNRQKRTTHSAQNYLLWSIFAYISYLLGLLAMYIVSMPTKEAISLASYDRYVGTITLYLVGVALVYILKSLDGSFPLLRTACATLALCLLLGSVWGQLGYLFYRSGSSDFTTDVREQLLQIKEDYALPEGASYYLITADGIDPGYQYYMAKYDLWSKDVNYSHEPAFEEIPEIIRRYNYLIVMNQNEYTLHFLAEAGMPAGEGAYDLSQYR